VSALGAVQPAVAAAERLRLPLDVDFEIVLVRTSADAAAVMAARDA
jgi:hypothetical protein